MQVQKVSTNLIQNVSKLGVGVEMPNRERNYCKFNEDRVNEILKNPNEAIPILEVFLNNAKSEKQVVEALYVIDKMAEAKVEGVDKLYPTLSQFNRTTSPNIQVMLSGIYRKTLVPDAYGPLHRMLAQQIFYPNSPYFDPTEEIGGAILEYNRYYAPKAYENSLKQ